MKTERLRTVRQGEKKSGPVIYWMSRDQRAHDNWALLSAQEIAKEQKAPLGVVFCLAPRFLGATIRQYGFMLDGLRETAANLNVHNIPFFLLRGSPDEEIPRFASEHNIGALVMDFDPLRVKRRWKRAVLPKIAVPAYEVDAHNIIPCWQASPKQEFAAYTFRPKVKRQLARFLDDFPDLEKHHFPWKGKRVAIDWAGLKRSLKVNRKVPEVDWIEPGETAAKRVLSRFVRNKLCGYDANRNDPTRDGQSMLSPYLHFGQISAQRAALDVRKKRKCPLDKKAFLEELIVRRELADNFCYYNEYYDNVQGFPDWALKTLGEHQNDRRHYLYSLEDFETGRTHDDLWNAAQMEMVKRGKMHGYMRMYWAKKILEWTATPEDALRMAIHLNDKYELDGRDPNGYVGIAWSIGGVHDRAWFPRPIFGKIRYMSYGGAKSKFDVKAYIRKS